MLPLHHPRSLHSPIGETTLLERLRLEDYDTLAGCLASVSTVVADGRTAQRPFYPGGLSRLTLVTYALALPPAVSIMLLQCAPAKGLRLGSDDTLRACGSPRSWLPEGPGNTLLSTSAGHGFRFS